MLHPGTRLSERYEIIGSLGAGGMGEVYRALDLRLEREVAVKVLPEHLAKNHHALARFEREAKALAALNHPNILSIYDFGEQDEIAFAVMELLTGDTLRTYVAKMNPSWEKSAAIVTSIVEGLVAAHSQGVIHRDLKPENIFITTDRTVKILDFGLARHEKISSAENVTTVATESQLTQEGVVMGTMPYMSPEQVRGLPLDARSDLFSLGTIFYEMLAGRRPFSGNSSADLVASILKENPPPMTDLKDCPASLKEVVAMCLRKDAEERFQSAHDLLAALKIASVSHGSFATAVVAKVEAKATSWRKFAWPILALIIFAIGGWLTLGRSKPVHSIAVLPFENSSHNPDSEYLSDGVTESIINTLSQIPGLRVMARGTVFTYKGKNVDPRQAGHELKVETVATGRIFQKGNTLAISADLVKVSDGSQLWGLRYNDRNLSDLLTIQNEISGAIIEHLQVPVSGQKKKMISKQSTQDNEAYQLLLKGRYHWIKDTPEDYDKASEYYHKALEKDPGYALAYVALGSYYSALALHGMEQPKVAWDTYGTYITKATKLDPYLVEATATGAEYKWFYLWDWAGAEHSFRRGIELNPGNAELHRFYAEFCRSQGRWDDAITELKSALELDPLSLAINKSLGVAYYWSKRYDQALEQLQKTLELDSEFADAHDSIADVYTRKGMYKEAIDETALYLKLSGDESGSVDLTREFEKSGYARAIEYLYEKQLEILKANSEEGYISPMFFVFTYTHLNQKDEAFHWLEEAYKERTPWLVFLKTDPQFDGLRSDPRFTALMKKVGLI